MTTPATVRALTRDERQLLARVNRWRRGNRWEQSFWPGWWRTVDGLAEVCWAEDPGVPGDELVVTWVDSRFGDECQARVRVTSVRQAVDVLVALNILPPQFSTAYTAAAEDIRQIIVAEQAAAEAKTPPTVPMYAAEDLGFVRAMGWAATIAQRVGAGWWAR